MENPWKTPSSHGCRVLGFLLDPLPRLAVEHAAQHRQRGAQDLDVVQRLAREDAHGGQGWDLQPMGSDETGDI